jgi:hypothetical protein
VSKRSIPRFVGAVLVGIGLAVALRLAFPQLATPTSVGDFHLQPLAAETPPAWRLEKLDGGYLASSDLSGTVALLYFWTTW